MVATRIFALFFLAAVTFVAIAIPGSHHAAAVTGCLLVVDSTADDTTENDVVTLREAIAYATDAPAFDDVAAGEQDEVSECPVDDDNPGAGRPDYITFDATVFPAPGPTTISLGSALPQLNTSGDTISGVGVVTVDGQGGDYSCFTITSSFNIISTLRILNCEVGVDIRSLVVPVSVQGDLGPSNNVVDRNVIVDNGTGVSISRSSLNTVTGNMIGLETDGSTPNGNDTGVRVSFGHSNIIGPETLLLTGTSQPSGIPSEVNVISGNVGNGIEIFNGDSDQVESNIIGLGLDGATPKGNGGSGVRVQNSVGTRIGSTDSSDRNVISSNTLDGVNIVQEFIPIAGAQPAGVSPADPNVVEGNFIGTDQSGFLPRGNGRNGVGINNALQNVIGGLDEGSGNLIADNGEAGVAIIGLFSSDNLVQGNTIGTDLDKLAAMGSPYGVFISDTPSNTVGGNTPEARNVIVGNGRGVGIFEQNSVDNHIMGNLIGELPNGGAMGNTTGVAVQNSGPNQIGGPTAAEGNIIAHNDEEGVEIVALPDVSSRKSILSNSIYDNGALGIDLEDDGVTLNDNKDPDTGANQHQNYPDLQSAEEDSGQTAVHGTLNSLPNTGFKIQLFANTECDSSGFGEGKVYLGDVIIPTTDNDGNATFDKTFDVALVGQFITATATDPDGNTSEFSACIFVSGTVLRVWGDIDCMNGLTAADSLGTLSADAGLAWVQADQCPEIDVPAEVDGTQRKWADWNCNGHLDTDDMLIGLKKIVDFIEAIGNCPEIGSNVSVVAEGP